MQCCVHTTSLQRGAFARGVQASAWQHATGTQSASVTQDGGDDPPGGEEMLLPRIPTMGGISGCLPSPGDGCSGCPDCTLGGDGGLAEADAGPGSA